MTARSRRDSQEAVALNSLAVVLVDRVHLENHARSGYLTYSGVMKRSGGLTGSTLCDKLVVKREGEVRNVPHVFVVIRVELWIKSCLGHLSYTLTLVVLRHVSVVLWNRRVGVLKEPVALLWQQNLEAQVNVLTCEAVCLEHFAYHVYSSVDVAGLVSLDLSSTLDSSLRWTFEALSNEVFPQLDLLLDELG